MLEVNEQKDLRKVRLRKWKSEVVVKPALIAVLNSEQYCKKENESSSI